MKKLLILLFGIMMIAGCVEETPTTTTTSMPTTTSIASTTTTSPISLAGNLVVRLKDKLDMTNITMINITVSKVEVHKAAGSETESNDTFETNDTSSSGWETVTNETKSYNLLSLVNTPGEVLGEKTLEAGKYTQIRLYISDSKITIDNSTYDVKVPSSRFYWIKPFYIESEKTTTLTLDFVASDSVKETGKGNYMLKPVVKITSETSPAGTTTTISTTTTTSTSTTTTLPTQQNYSVDVSAEIGIGTNS